MSTVGAKVWEEFKEWECAELDTFAFRRNLMTYAEIEKEFDEAMQSGPDLDDTAETFLLDEMESW